MRYIIKIIKNILLLMIFIWVVSCRTTVQLAHFSTENRDINWLSDSLTDENYLNLLKPYSDKLNSELTEIIAYTDTSLTAYRPESPLTNLISDIMLDYGNKYIKEKYPDVHISFSLENKAGLRNSLPSGPICRGNIFEMIPFENELILLKLTGEQVSLLADFIAFRGGEGVSGLTFGIKSGKAVNLKVRELSPVSDSTYWIITNDYLAGGGDGFKVLKDASETIKTSQKLRDVIIQQLILLNREGRHISAKTEGRIYHVE